MRRIGYQSVLRRIRRGAPTSSRYAGKFRSACALAAITVSPILSGCILGTERPELNLDMSATYRAAPKGDADAALPVVDWWRGFRSRELSALMDAAQIRNLDIAVAVAQRSTAPNSSQNRL